MGDQISLWWSFALTTIGVAGLFFVYRSQTMVGPAIGLAVQVLWIAYAIVTSQWWFLLSALTYGGVNIYGITSRRRTAQEHASTMSSTGIGVTDGPLTLRHLRVITNDAKHWPDTSTVHLDDSRHMHIVKAEDR